MSSFSHLHNHTMYSLLDGASDIGRLFKKALADDMPALAITDHGNMFGVFQFVAEAGKHRDAQGNYKIKPIIGCEFYVVADRHKKQFSREEKDVRYHQVLLAKNETGYRNLVKMCSIGYMEGCYGKFPRIDKEIIEKYHEGLIATTCCLAAMVPRLIAEKNIEAAEAEFRWWLDMFGDDYYIELQRHAIPEQESVNATLLQFAAKYKVPVIATNDAHYVDREDANAHDILLCINTGEKQATPKAREFGDDDMAVRGKRFAFYNDQFYFKTTAEMASLFEDVPQAIDATNEIADKVFAPNLTRDILLPNYQVPGGFDDQDAYLRHLAYEGAAKRYTELTAEITERIEFELFTIKTMGFAGYFLIVEDFIREARGMDVFVGPGRGSAAGSVVAFCIGITNIDPMKYNLLFERFLNPERKSMPDIDTDFDDEGRQKVINYVVKKYGYNQVAQLITYGTMAAKTSIRDVARVLDLPLPDSNALSKLVPERPGISLNRLLTAPLSGENSLHDKENLSADELEHTRMLRKIFKDAKDPRSGILQEAMRLEGSVRNTGIHAAGIIIAPKDLTELIPVATSKESELLVTQYDGDVIERAGVIKMDFLGLRTLSILKTALQHIRRNHGKEINIDAIPLDDQETFGLYQRAETNGTFQFESPGMQKHLKVLKPDKFEDLIAMNALYRPGPLEYIPTYIARKHGLDKIQYDLPEMEEILKETYGVTVYQEQVMLLSQKLAGFTKADADNLRKAMGKKQKSVLDKMKSRFMDGCAKNQLNLKICEKIWSDWEAFAQYAFNKSHSTCYAWVAYQTAYLKVHYPAEYMCAVLTHNQGNLDKVSFFMEECKRMGIEVLPPDINESGVSFSVNKKGQIRFGLSAIKGVGAGAVEELIAEREKNGEYVNFFDLCRRVNVRSVNKKTLEGLVHAGALDGFGLHRAQYFAFAKNEPNTLIEQAMKYGGRFNGVKETMQHTLFEDAAGGLETAEPKIPDCAEWNAMEKLQKEFEVIGIYLSGHPLDTYRHEAEAFRTCTLQEVNSHIGQEISVVGFVVNSETRTAKSGNKYINFTIEDYSGTLPCVLFSSNYIRFKSYVEEPGQVIYVRGMCKAGRMDAEKGEIHISELALLSEVRERKSMKLTVSIPLSGISKPLLEDLGSILRSHPGRDQLVVQVTEEQEQYKVDLRSANGCIQAETDVIRDLQRIGAVALSVAG